MKMKTTAIILSVLALMAAGCSSTRKIKKDYTLVDVSSGEYPEWLTKPSSADEEKKRRKYRYFVSESSAKNKRLCLRSAQGRATTKIAQEIVQFIKNTYAETIQSEESEEASKYAQEELVQETQTHVIGAQVFKNYWEKRRYQMELGATSDETKYSCFALVKIKKSALGKAIEHSRKKFLSSIPNPKLKEKLDKATSEVKENFNQEQ